MGLSSIFKPKPMVSVVLTKEIQDPSKEESEFSSFEARLDKLGSKLQKLKKYSKKVFECNNQETLSAVEECCTQLKKERCKAKKQRNVCSKNPDDVDGDSMEIEDFSCGDQLTLSGESVDECEGDKAACPKEEACDDDDNGKREEQENECEEEEEEDECEKEIKKCSCQNGDDKDDKCTQVMTFEPKGSTYLISQIEFENEYISKPLTLSPSFSLSKVPLKSEKKQGSSKNKVSKNNSFVMPIITTTSARSLSKASRSASKTSARSLKNKETEDVSIEEHHSLNKQTLQTYNVQSSSRVEEESIADKMPSDLSQGKNRSRSLSRPGSRSSFKKEHLLSVSASRTPPNSLISKVNVESLTEEDVLNDDSMENNPQQPTPNLSDPYSENKQHSIVYIMQTPPKQNETNLTSEGTIHIDASKVFIQNSASSEIQSGSFVDNTHQKPVIVKKQKSSESEVVMSEITAAPSDKLETRVSFQQPEVIECTEIRPNLHGLNQVDKSGTSTNALYDNSSKIISNVTGPTSQTLVVSNTEIKSKESKPSQASECDTMKTSQDQFVSDCSFIKPSQAQFVSDCEIYYSNSGKKLLVKGLSAASHSKEPLGSLNSFKNSMDSSDRKKVTDEMELDTLISSLSQTGNQDIQVQSVQLSKSGLEKNSTSKVSQVSSGVSAGYQISMTTNNTKLAESQNNVMSSTSMNEKVNKSMEKASFNVLSNISGAKESLNKSMTKRVSSHSSVKVKVDESVKSPQQSNSTKVKVSGVSIDCSNATNSSSKTLENQEKSEELQKNETIAMFVDTTMELPRNRSKEFLFMHCRKCKEVCIAKIVEKKQPPQNIWVGQGN